MYVDEYTIRILGEVIEHGEDRSGYPVTSQYDQKRKKKRGCPKRNWTSEYLELDMSKEAIEAERRGVSSRVKDLESDVKVLRQQHAQLDRQLSEASSQHRVNERTLKGTTGTNVSLQELESYVQLQEARNNVRETRTTLGSQEADLRNGRREQYYWQKMSKMSEGSTPKSRPRKEAVMTKPTRDNPVAEDFTESLDISGLTGVDVTFAGTDYGLRKMSVTVPMTPKAIEIHLNRFHALGELNGRRLEGKE